MEPSQVASFLIPMAIGLALTIGSYLFARKAGLMPVQDQLVDTLKDNAAALADRVGLLKDELDAAEREVDALRNDIQRLRSALVDLAAENAELRRKFNLTPKVMGPS